MPIRMMNRAQSLSPNIYCEYTDGRYQEEGLQLIEKYMPYLNPETGLKNRMISRDPVTGLGELEKEYNPLNGCHLRRRNVPYRNPIIMEGELGTEYNCVNTTVEKPRRPRIQRDPITLQGDLGQELDHLRPHGGLTRHHNQDIPQRDPISGEGNFTSERDPFRKTDGIRTLNQSTPAVRTDPITHSTASSNSSGAPSMRHYSQTWKARDPIGFTDEDTNEIRKYYNKGLRHFPQNSGVTDPITHRYNTCSAVRSRFRRPQLSRNPITHEMRDYANEKSGGEVENQHQLDQQVQSVYRSTRNPITGEGINEEDCIDLLKLPSEYCFRRKIAAPTATERKPSPAHKVEKPAKPTAGPKKIPAAEREKPKPSEEQPVVKKVIRPKRQTASAQESAPKVSTKSIGEEIKTTDGNANANKPGEEQNNSKQKELKSDHVEASDIKVEANDIKVGASDVKLEANDIKVGASDVKLEANDTKVGASDMKVEANGIKVGASDMKAEVISTSADVNDIKANVNEMKAEVNDTNKNSNYTEANVGEMKLEASDTKAETSNNATSDTVIEKNSTEPSLVAPDNISEQS